MERIGYRVLPETDPRSIPFEVVSHLDILNHQLIVPSDIPAIVEFLDAPEGREIDAWARWREYWDSIDFEARKLELVADPYYSC